MKSQKLGIGWIDSPINKMSFGGFVFVKNRIARKLINIVGINKKKVFAIGFNKCATSSLHALFNSLGLLSYHGTLWRDCNNLKLLRSFDCFSDGVPSDLTKLDELFPNSKFILQVRDLESWIYSRLAHIDREKSQGKLVRGPEWDTTGYAIERWIEKRNSHHTFVLSYFEQRPQDLLLVNFIRDELAAQKVVDFLGFDRSFDRPHRNRNPKKDRPANHKNLLDNCLQKMGIPEKELAYDILCPSLLSSSNPERQPHDTSLVIAGSFWGKPPLGR